MLITLAVLAPFGPALVLFELFGPHPIPTALVLEVPALWWVLYRTSNARMRFEGGDVVVRNVLWTHRFRAADVERVESVWWLYGHPTLQNIAAIKVVGRRRRIRVSATVGDFYKRDVEALAQQIRRAARFSSASDSRSRRKR